MISSQRKYSSFTHSFVYEIVIKFYIMEGTK